MLPLVATATLIATGAGFAYSTERLRRKAALATASLAIVLHICVLVALSAARSEALLTPHLLTPLQSVALVVAACVDSAGLWVPAALVPWAAVRERSLTVAAILASGVIAAEAFYLPTDVLVINDKVVLPSRLGYNMTLIAGFLFVAIGFAFAKLFNR